MQNCAYHPKEGVSYASAEIGMCRLDVPEKGDK